MRAATGWLLLLVAACASQVHRVPVELNQVETVAAKRFLLRHSVAFVLDSRYERSLLAGTVFLESGSIKHGKVLKPLNATLTVEGAHMHEAYLVLDGHRLAGFYLPVERAFSPLSRTVNLVLEPQEEK